MKIKFLSWNIWGGRRLEKILAAINEFDPDVIALQEVSEKNIEGNISNNAGTIASQLGYQLFYGKSFTTDRHFPPYSIGNAVLSKFPILESRSTELSGLARYKKDSITEPRNAVIVKLQIDTIEVNVISTHLGHSDDSQATPLQLIQVEKLLSSIPPENTIIGVDLNSVPSGDLVINFKKSLEAIKPSILEIGSKIQAEEEIPVQRIDYVFASENFKPTYFSMPETDASDHLPIIAEFEV